MRRCPECQCVLDFTPQPIAAPVAEPAPYADMTEYRWEMAYSMNRRHDERARIHEACQRAQAQPFGLKELVWAFSPERAA